MNPQKQVSITFYTGYIKSGSYLPGPNLDYINVLAPTRLIVFGFMISIELNKMWHYFVSWLTMKLLYIGPWYWENGYMKCINVCFIRESGSRNICMLVVLFVNESWYPSGWICFCSLMLRPQFSLTKFWIFFFQITLAFSRTTAPILGLFVLIWMHFSCWIQRWGMAMKVWISTYFENKIEIVLLFILDIQGQGHGGAEGAKALPNSFKKKRQN